MVVRQLLITQILRLNFIRVLSGPKILRRKQDSWTAGVMVHLNWQPKGVQSTCTCGNFGFAYFTMNSKPFSHYCHE